MLFAAVQNAFSPALIILPPIFFSLSAKQGLSRKSIEVLFTLAVLMIVATILLLLPLYSMIHGKIDKATVFLTSRNGEIRNEKELDEKEKEELESYLSCGYYKCSKKIYCADIGFKIIVSNKSMLIYATDIRDDPETILFGEDTVFEHSIYFKPCKGGVKNFLKKLTGITFPLERTGDAPAHPGWDKKT